MKTLLSLLMLLAVSVSADMFLYSSDGKILSHDKTILPNTDGKGNIVHISTTNVVYLGSTTNDMTVGNYTNTSQLTYSQITFKDVKADLDEISPEVMKAMLTAMIKVVNQRLPAGQKITAEEMKTAIKAELP